MKFLNELARKRGWTVESRESILKKYIDSRPKQVKLSDSDILAELNVVRYKK